MQIRLATRHLLLAAAAAVLFLRPSPATAQPRIVDATLGQDRIDRANGYDIVNPTTEFRPESPKIVCVFKMEGAGIGTRVRGVWLAEDVGTAAPRNYKIDERTLAIPFMNSGSMFVTRPNNGWPTGSYRLEIYVGATLAKTLKFSVRRQS